ncbi:MAG: hypothetical protein J6D47_13215 [Peptostreptococcaceae bacterium]|nr:hypothetical protein [Peptostreptococcaceae bacterium]
MNTLESYKEYTRDKIMSLPGKELLEYVNYMLDQGYSFGKLCEEKQLRNKTIRARLKERCGAVYDTRLKKYVINEVKIQSEYDNNVIETPIETHNAISNVTPIEIHNVTPGILSIQDTATINELKEAILGLTNQLAKVNVIQPVEQPQEAKNTPKIGGEDITFNVLNLNGEVKARPMKLYPEVIDRLDAFCDKHKQYSKQRIISTLLMEAMNKYE